MTDVLLNAEQIHFADFIIVVAMTNSELGLKGMSVFYVEANTSGLSVQTPPGFEPLNFSLLSVVRN